MLRSRSGIDDGCVQVCTTLDMSDTYELSQDLSKTLGSNGSNQDFNSTSTSDDSDDFIRGAETQLDDGRPQPKEVKDTTSKGSVHVMFCFILLRYPITNGDCYLSVTLSVID